MWFKNCTKTYKSRKLWFFNKVILRVYTGIVQNTDFLEENYNLVVETCLEQIYISVRRLNLRFNNLLVPNIQSYCLLQFSEATKNVESGSKSVLLLQLSSQFKSFQAVLVISINFLLIISILTKS